MPKLLTQGVSSEPKTGRQLIGIVAGFKSERWPVIDRNAGRLQLGIRMQAAEPLLSWFQKEAHRAGSIIVNDPFQFRLSSARFSSGSNKIIDEVVEPFMP